MAVPDAIAWAFSDYLEAMASGVKDRRRLDVILGWGGAVDNERCQDDFVSALSAAVEDCAAAGPSSEEAAEALEFIFSRAHANRKSGQAYWMLLASHVFALPLVKCLSPDAAARLLAAYEAEFPRRERFPAQTTMIAALSERAAAE